MKNVCYLFVLLAFLATINPVVGKTVEPRFIPGDWFECEMEFVDDVPVFHNHWANNDSVDLPQQYMVVRFSLDENTSDSVEVWCYKIIRSRLLIGMKPKKINDYQCNAHCFDSWYHDYFIEDLDTVRKNLTGTLKLVNHVINEHYMIYSESENHEYFTAKSIFPLNNGGSFGSSSTWGVGSRMDKLIESMFSLTFGTINLEANYSVPSKRLIIQQVNFSNKDSVLFSINNKDFSNNYTAYLLPNGVAYAFKDKYNQKVMAITNASFPLPNKAVVTIYDYRSKKDERKKYFDNISIDFGNVAHVISQNVKEENNISEYNFQLKCGVEMILRNNYFPDQSVFVEPGDSIQITIQDDKSNPVIVSGIDNFKEYQRLLKGTVEEIQASSLSPESKAYLILKSKIISTYSKLYNTPLYSAPDVKDYQHAMVDLYYLKSFHYKTLFELDNAGTVVSMGNYWQQNQIHASGAPFYTNFKYRYYNALTNYSQFSLYAKLYVTLYSSIKLDKETYYDEFLTNCGDTIITNKLRDRLNGVKSMQVGMKMPFSKLLTEHEQEVDILPKKGKFGLLFLYVLPNDWVSLKKSLQDELPENVQYVSYQISREPIFKSDKLLTVTALSKVDSLELFGHPSKTSEMDNLLYGSLEGILILYDDKGTIWYNSSYYAHPDEGNAKYITAIKEAIQRAKTKPVSKSKNILLIILLSVIGSVSLTPLFYRIRIARLKKKNARQQLIQELKLKSVQSQLNPHFLFNALNSIQVLVKSGDTKRADNYLVGFSELLRNVLQNADKRLVPLSEELKMVNRYCELEKLRMDFDCELEINTTTSSDLIEIPYMLLQPVIENAIKHGVAKSGEKGLLQIIISEEHASLHIRVTDNGPGFDGISLDVLKEKGRGLKLSLEKLQTIYGNEAEFVLLAANPGTTVSIKLKIG